MSRKRHTPEEIVTKLRQVDVLVNRRHRAELRDQLLDGEIFTSLQVGMDLLGRAWSEPVLLTIGYAFE
jgi:hypothetical protein